MEVVLTKEYIENLIAQKGISKSEFAEKMGVKKQNLDALLEGKKKDINNCIRMAEILGMDLLTFLGMRKDIRINGCVYLNDEPYLIRQKEDLQNLIVKIEALEIEK